MSVATANRAEIPRNGMINLAEKAHPRQGTGY